VSGGDGWRNINGAAPRSPDLSLLFGPSRIGFSLRRAFLRIGWRNLVQNGNRDDALLIWAESRPLTAPALRRTTSSDLTDKSVGADLGLTPEGDASRRDVRYRKKGRAITQSVSRNGSPVNSGKRGCLRSFIAVKLRACFSTVA
jgi:hypothetical protein